MKLKEGVSIVIRSLNEEKFIGACLKSIFTQNIDLPVEVILVDSGSSDDTVLIAKKYGCKIKEISKKTFTFGRAINLGVNLARYDFIVSISAHCVPCHDSWLSKLIDPLRGKVAAMTFGAHEGASSSRSSEISYFRTRYRGDSGIRNAAHFNNGNSAFLRQLWLSRPFDESLPAQEDVEFCRWHMKTNGSKLYYCKNANVIHFHNDCNKTLYNRLYRELNVEFMLGEKNISSLILFFLQLPLFLIDDAIVAHKKSALRRALWGILGFRVVQSTAFINAAIVHYSNFQWFK